MDKMQNFMHKQKFLPLFNNYLIMHKWIVVEYENVKSTT